MQCDAIMTQKPYFLSAQQPAMEAANQMRRLNLRFLPICDGEGRVVGGLTDRDIVERLVADGLSAQTPVQDLMSQEVYSCQTRDEADQAQRQMAEHEVERLVCLDDDGRLVGMVALGDITSPQNFAVPPRRSEGRLAGH